MAHCVVMRILIIGATGTIGRPVAAELKGRHELVLASKNKADEKVDISDPASIRALLKRVGKVDAIVVAAGDAAFKPFAALTDEDFALSLRSKLMGQVNVVRFGMDSVNDGGSFTITSGTLADQPMINGAAASTVNGAINSFARAAAHEAPRGIRVNAVAPPWITETLVAYKMDVEGGMPAADVARAYARSVEGKQTGQILAPAFSSRS
jgi:NAD(P)-dependent dehydrogenase (short-subunit alcohol dehydrogenase family)